MLVLSAHACEAGPFPSDPSPWEGGKRRRRRKRRGTRKKRRRGRGRRRRRKRKNFETGSHIGEDAFELTK